MKTVNLYQQTFWGQDASSWDFQFNRVYKRRPENRLIIRAIQSVAGISGSGKSDKPYVISLTNGADITGRCNLYYNFPGAVSPAPQVISSANPFVLGISGSSAHPTSASSSPSIIVNDLPLNKMTITVQHFDLDPAGSVNCVVIFEIEEIEEV